MQEQKSLDEQLWFAIHATDDKQDIPKMKRLIDSGATLIQYDKSGYTVFHNAVFSHEIRSAVAGYMLEKKPFVVINDKKIPTIELPLSNGLTSLQKAVLGAGTKFDSARSRIVEFLTAHGANTEVLFDNKSGHTPLYVAATQGSVKVTEALIKGGAKLEVRDENGNTPLLAALIHGKDEVAKMLIKAGAKVDVANNANVTPLNLAAEHGLATTIGLMIGFDANVNGVITDDQKNTALDVALKAGHFGAAIVLIKYGANLAGVRKPVNNPSQFSEESKASFQGCGSLLLLIAVQMNNAAIVEYCFDVAKKTGIQLDTSLKDSNGQDVYTLSASIRHNARIFRLIIENEAAQKLNEYHETSHLGGLTAIHFAAVLGDREAIKYLVNEMKVSINALVQHDSLHITALDLARNVLKPSNPDFVHFLESYGAISGADEQKAALLHTYNQQKSQHLHKMANVILKDIDHELKKFDSSESLSTSTSGSSSPESSPKKSGKETRSASYSANQHGTLFQHKELVVPANPAKKAKSRRGCEVM